MEPDEFDQMNEDAATIAEWFLCGCLVAVMAAVLIYCLPKW
jgi:hypothetical protein